jgi:DNA-binding transcriptional LysR family regulator
MVVSDIDLRLLKVFCAVVESGGFSNAQTVLNVSQSTISTQMSQLETRVGFVLCQRGRSGFRLTSEGQQFYQQVLELFHSIKGFETRTATLRGSLSGILRIGFLDNIISDEACPLRDALRDFIRQPGNRVHVELDVLAPHVIEQGLLNHSLDLGIGIFSHRVAGLQYDPLYRERDLLVCHRSHRLACIENPRVLARALSSAGQVHRSFLGSDEFPFAATDAPVTRVTSLEASALLISTGAWIGFLPHHYARPWIERGEFVALLPDKFVRYSEFMLVTRERHTPASSAQAALLRCFARARREDRDVNPLRNVTADAPC